MVHHYKIKPVTSWYNITSRDAIESYSRSFIYQNIQWTKIRISKTILELLKCTRARSRTPPIGTVLAAAIHVYGCQLDVLWLPWLPLAMYHLFFFHVYTWLCNILWSLIVHCWKINLLLQQLLQPCYASLWYTLISMVYIVIRVMFWWTEQFAQQPFRSRYILQISENITPDAGLALVVHEPSCSITFLTGHIYVLDVKHCQSKLI